MKYKINILDNIQTAEKASNKFPDATSKSLSPHPMKEKEQTTLNTASEKKNEKKASLLPSSDLYKQNILINKHRRGV